MTESELTIHDLITALSNIRRWAAAVRAALEAGDPAAVIARLHGMEITNQHLIATQVITETWTESVRVALDALEDKDSIRFPVSASTLYPDLEPLGKKLPCRISPSPPIVGDQCGIDVRAWMNDLIELR